MKKILFCLILLFSLTGCDKTLKCVSTVDNASFKVKKTYKVYSNKDIISKVQENIIYEVSDRYSSSDFDSMVVLLKTEYQLKEIPFEYSNSGRKHVFDVTYYVDSLSEDTFNEYIGFKDLSMYKQKLIDDGFKCK